MALRIVTWFLLLLFTGLFQGQAWARVCNGGLEGGYWQSSPGFSARHFNADSDGSLRVRREVTSTSTNDYRYIYDGRAILQERDAKNLPTWTVSRGPTGLLALSRHRRSYADHAYYYTDAHGNVVALVNDYQNVVARYLYDPYGNQVAISGPWADANPFRFSSQYYHAPSGLHAYACRFYDPGLQRWLTPDPLGEAADNNLYRFVGNDPVNRIDPLGLDYRSVAQMNIFGVIPAPNGIVPYVTGDTWGERTVAGINNAGALVSNMSYQILRNLDVLVERFEHAVNAPGITQALPMLGIEASAMRGLKLATRATACLEEGAAAKTIDASAVRFSQSSISRNFSAGGTIDDLAAGLRNGSVNPANIPPIRLVEQEGNLFTLDNRRLWSFQQAEVPVPYRMATPQEAAAEAWKITTKNGGTSIRVRGQ